MGGESSLFGPAARPVRLLYSPDRDRAAAAAFDLQRDARAGRPPVTRDGRRGARPRVELMTTADFVDAARLYQRVIGFDDAAITGAALVGLGEALHRLDDEAQALSTWEEATRLPDNPATYAAWRNVAAARGPRRATCMGAIAAYREAEKRAPQSDKPRSRPGSDGCRRRSATRARPAGTSPAPGASRGSRSPSASLAVTVDRLADHRLRRPGRPGAAPAARAQQAAGRGGRAVAAVDRRRSSTRRSGRCRSTSCSTCTSCTWRARSSSASTAAGPSSPCTCCSPPGASLTSFAFTAPPDAPIAVGASGAIFGLFGLLVAAERIHRPVLDQQSRSFMGQLTGLVVINLLFGFLVPGIDNLAHIGGLVTGLVIGVLFAPTRVPTLRSLWVRPGPTPGTTVPAFGRGGATARSAPRVSGSWLSRSSSCGRWAPPPGGSGVLDAPRPVAAGLRERDVAVVARDGPRPGFAAVSELEQGDRGTGGRGRRASRSPPASTS